MKYEYIAYLWLVGRTVAEVIVEGTGREGGGGGARAEKEEAA